MRGFNYKEAANFNRGIVDIFPSFREQIKDEKVREIASVFRENLLRVIFLLAMGPNGFIWGYISGEVDEKVRQAKACESGIDVMAETARLIMEKEEHHEKIFSDGESPETTGFQKFEASATKSQQFGRLGIQAIYTSSLMMAWSAYEVLAGDLWEETLNTRSRTLLPRLAGATKSDLLYRKIDVSKVPSAKVGTCLKDDGQVRPDSAKRIDALYGVTFKNEWATMKSKAYNNDLRALGNVRNLIAHANGVIDQTTIDRWTEDAITGFTVPAKDRSWEFDGVECRKLISAVSCAGKDLIEFVNNWLIANP